MKVTKLSFHVLPDTDCKYLSIADTSFYSSTQVISEALLQIITPFDDTPVDTMYYKNAVIVLNSNTLKITNVQNLEYLTELPDGLYTAKISICPQDRFFYEQSWYKTCLLECKFDKAFLKLKVQSCESCFSPDKLKSLDRAWIYIKSIQANVKDCNYKEADKLYKAADKILDRILECDC